MHLRTPASSDRDEWCALRRSSEAFLRPWEPRLETDVNGSPEARFGRLLADNETPTVVRTLIVHNDDDAILGMANLSQLFLGPFRNAILGYWIGQAHARRGYATSGVRLLVSHAFEDLGLHRVEANVVPGNDPSHALLCRLGFREEGYSPRYLQIDGAWRDHVRYAVTSEEWPQA